jgi:cell division initiation protein
MNVSPLDLRQQRFRKAFRGFDPVEVTSFLAAVADDYEHALRETDRLRQDLMRMEAVLNEHREHEKNLQSTLLTAQKVSDDIKANAELEARMIIREAEGRSELLLERTQARLEDIQREIDGLKLKRRYNLGAPKGVRGRCSENTLIKEKLGWAPSITLRDGMERTYHWIHDQMVTPATARRVYA